MKNYINSLYVRRPIKIKQNKQKPFTAYIERVESSEYKRLGFQDLHYMKENLNKSFICLLITNKRGSPLAFIALRNHTFKGCSNGIMVSRFVIKPSYQRRGLSVPLLSLIGGMLKADGKRLFINTHLEGFGKALGKSESFKGTTTDLRERKNTNDGKYKNRQSGIAYRKEYIGKEIKGHKMLFKKIKVLRESFQGTIVRDTLLQPDKDACQCFHHMTQLVIILWHTEQTTRKPFKRPQVLNN